jgi:hypothetical protein
MLLNFVLHSSIQERCGVDLTKFFPEEVIAEDNIQKERKGKCDGNNGLPVRWVCVRHLIRPCKECFGPWKEFSDSKTKNLMFLHGSTCG